MDSYHMNNWLEINSGVSTRELSNQIEKLVRMFEELHVSFGYSDCSRVLITIWADPYHEGDVYNVEFMLTIHDHLNEALRMEDSDAINDTAIDIRTTLQHRAIWAQALKKLGFEATRIERDHTNPPVIDFFYEKILLDKKEAAQNLVALAKQFETLFYEPTKSTCIGLCLPEAIEKLGKWEREFLHGCYKAFIQDRRQGSPKKGWRTVSGIAEELKRPKKIVYQHISALNSLCNLTFLLKKPYRGPGRRWGKIIYKYKFNPKVYAEIDKEELNKIFQSS